MLAVWFLRSGPAVEIALVTNLMIVRQIKSVARLDRVYKVNSFTTVFRVITTFSVLFPMVKVVYNQLSWLSCSN